MMDRPFLQQHKVEEPVRPPPPPPPPKPPQATREPSAPSETVLALTRLVDLEAQMEFAFAKQMALIAEQKKLEIQYKVLENLPVGLEAYQEELDRLKKEKEEARQLYGDEVC
jgi:hypothetical protein